MLRHAFARGISRRAQLQFPVLMRGLRRNIFVARGAVVSRMSSLYCEKNGWIEIGENSFIGQFAILKAYGGRISLGNNVSINAFTFINGAGGVLIGNDVRIAAHCSIISANHIFSDPEVLIRHQGSSCEGVAIHDDVWIGTGVRILDGVTVGRGAVIAAGAVVTKSVDPYHVVAGVPARVIKRRGVAVE